MLIGYFVADLALHKTLHMTSRSIAAMSFAKFTFSICHQAYEATQFIALALLTHHGINAPLDGLFKRRPPRFARIAHDVLRPWLGFDIRREMRNMPIATEPCLCGAN